MRIGVVCEGPTDFPTIKSFFGDSLFRAGIQSEFVSIFPDFDNTRPVGGWGNVLIWLDKNSPDIRVQRYFYGGLFGGALSSSPLDAILIQLDSDVIDDVLFQNYVSERYGVAVVPLGDAIGRAAQIVDIIGRAANFDGMTEADVARHVPAVAIEASETWCVAAFHAQQNDYEQLRGRDLVNAFMTALEKSEGRVPQKEYAVISKDPSRRTRFCATHAKGSPRITASCPQFATTLGKLELLGISS